MMNGAGPMATISHVRSWTDQWEWLRNSPDELQRVLEDEAECSERVLAGPARRADALVGVPVADLFYEQASQPAVRSGDFWYLMVLDGEAGSPSIMRVPHDSDEPEPTATDLMSDPRAQVALNVAELAPGASLGSVVFSSDGRIVCWTEDPDGSESYRVHVTSVAGQKELLDPIDGCSGSVVLDEKGSRVVWVGLDGTRRPAAVFAKSFSDGRVTVLHHECDERLRLRMKQCVSGDFLLLDAVSRTMVRHFISRLGAADLRLRQVAVLPFEGRSTLDVGELDGRPALFATVATDDQPNGRLLVRFIDRLGGAEGDWRCLIEHDERSVLAPVLVTRRNLVIGRRREGHQGIVIAKPTVPLTGIRSVRGATGSELSVTALPDWDGSVLRVGVSSYVHRPLSGRVDLDETEPRVELAALNEDVYETKELFGETADGVRIPITLVGRRDRTGPAPCLLSVYGAYGVNQRPNYNPLLLKLFDAGMVFAVAHVRGGGELGPRWHTVATGLGKPLTFTDVLACLDALVARRTADPNRVALIGGSAGGLAVGAVLNLAPERFRAVVADMPFVDPLTTMMHPDLPLTISDRSEWGDPLADPRIFECIRGYSPCQNVRDAVYPPVLATVRTRDARVSPLEALKWIRALRTTARGGPFVLRVRSGGHLHAASFDATVHDTAVQYAWIADQLGVDLTGGCRGPNPSR